MTDDLTTALERAAQPAETKNVLDLIERMTPELAKALPAHLNTERFKRIVVTELRRTPKLYECSPASLLGAMMLSAQLGLEPGPLGHVYLVPFKREVTFIIGYKGLIDLAYRSGQLKSIRAKTVREGDSFEYRDGTRAFLDHSVHEPPAEREPVAYWALAELKTGGKPFVVLYPDEIEATRKRSPAGRADSGPWVTDYDAMARKTAIRRLAPVLPVSPALATALERDEAPAPTVDETLPLDGDA